MPSLLKGFLSNIFKSARNPKGNLGDFAHAARLFVDDSFKFAPHMKFLYHVTFNINPNAKVVINQKKLQDFQTLHGNDLNMLVKRCDLPKYSIQNSVVQQYNRKKNIQTRIDYDPINIDFHDDNFGVTTFLWEMYYRYYFKDGSYGKRGPLTPEASAPKEYIYKNHLTGAVNNKYRFGLDNNSNEPFFNSIQIHQLARKRFTAYTLVNPIITTWQGDTLDAGDATGVTANRMTIQFETVFMSRGSVIRGKSPKGFGALHYDSVASPINIAGGGTRSVFGRGGLVDAIPGLRGLFPGNTGPYSDVEGSAPNPGGIGRGILGAINAARNLKKLSKEGLREEGFRVAKEAIGRVGKSLNGIPNVNIPTQNPQANNVTKASLPGSE